MHSKQMPPAFLDHAFQKDPMVDPVVTPDGFSYERKDVSKWVADKLTEPQTRNPVNIKELIPNKALKKIINEFREMEEKKCSLIELYRQKAAVKIKELKEYQRELSAAAGKYSFNYKDVITDWPFGLICPVKHTVFKNPHISTEGTTYEASAIEEKLIPNRNLKEALPHFNINIDDNFREQLQEIQKLIVQIRQAEQKLKSFQKAVRERQEKKKRMLWGAGALLGIGYVGTLAVRILTKPEINDQNAAIMNSNNWLGEELLAPIVTAGYAVGAFCLQTLRNFPSNVVFQLDKREANAKVMSCDHITINCQKGIKWGIKNNQLDQLDFPQPLEPKNFKEAVDMAIARNNLEQLKQLKKIKVCIISALPDKLPDSLWHDTHLEMLKFLLDEGLPVDRSPLSKVIDWGQIKTAELLVDRGASLDPADGQQPPLWEAIRRNHWELAGKIMNKDFLLARKILKDYRELRGYIAQSDHPSLISKTIGILSDDVPSLNFLNPALEPEKWQKKLITAAKNGYYPVVKEILKQIPMDVQTLNLALVEAKKAKHTAVYNLLRHHKLTMSAHVVSVAHFHLHKPAPQQQKIISKKSERRVKQHR